MKLAHPALSKPICFKENQIQLLIIESPRMFRQFAFELIAQSEGQEGEFILSLNNDILDCAEHLHIIYDYYHLEPEGKKLHNRFQAEIQSVTKNELLHETLALEESINNYLRHLRLLCGSAAFEEGQYIPALLKGVKFAPALEDESPLGRLISHISIYNSLMPDQCFILMGAKAIFETEELTQLYTWADYVHCRILLLEPACSQPLEKENPFILDRDMCEIHIDSNSGHAI